MIEPLKAERVQDRVEQLPDWEAEIDDSAENEKTRRTAGELEKKYKAIRRSFQFSCFIEAMAFVDHVADVAWEMRVNPGIYVHDEHVSITIPGDASGVTHADVDLAVAIDELVV